MLSTIAAVRGLWDSPGIDRLCFGKLFSPSGDCSIARGRSQISADARVVGDGGLTVGRRKHLFSKSGLRPQLRRSLGRWGPSSVGVPGGASTRPASLSRSRHSMDVKAVLFLPPEQIMQPITLPLPELIRNVILRIPETWEVLPVIGQVPLALGVVAFAAWGLGPTMKALRKLATGQEVDWELSRTKQLMTNYMRPIFLWLGVLLVCRALNRIPVSTEAGIAVKARFIKFVSTLSTVTAFASCTVSFVQYLQKFLMEAPPKSVIDEKEPPQRAQASSEVGIKFAGSVVSTLVWVAAVCLFMELLGFRTQRWLTAGGFGTVLITLAGREIVTNFLSSIMIHATRPFLVNDWIQTKIEGQDVSGTVEHVGWWSPTVVRGDDREAVHIPNHKFSVSVVRNLSQKTHWRVKAHFGISHYDVNKLQYILTDMRKILANHPLVEQQRLHRRVFFDYIDSNSQSLMILVSCFVKTSQIEEYLRVKEQILLDLLRVISNRNARLATPIRSVQRLLDEADAFREGGRQNPTAQVHQQVLLMETSVVDSDDEDGEEAEAVHAEPDHQLTEPEKVEDPKEDEKETAAPDLPAKSVPASPSKVVPELQPTAVPAASVAGAVDPLAVQVQDNSKLYAPEQSISDHDFLTSPITAKVNEFGAAPDIAPTKDGLSANKTVFRPPLDTPKPRTRKERKAVMRNAVGGQETRAERNGAQESKELQFDPAPQESQDLKLVGSGLNSSDDEVKAPKSSLKGLSSMGLNDNDITLLGAAYEKPPANIPDGPLESGPYVVMPAGKPDKGLAGAGEDVQVKPPPQQLEDVVAKSAAAKGTQQLEELLAKSLSSKGLDTSMPKAPMKAAPQQLEEVVAKSVAANAAVQRAGGKTVGAVNSEESVHAHVIGPQGKGIEEYLKDPWRMGNDADPAAGSGGGSSASTWPRSDVEGSGSSASIWPRSDAGFADERLAPGAGEVKVSQPPLSTRLPQNVEENLVLAVAIDGPKRTLPLGEELDMQKRDERVGDVPREMARVGGDRASVRSSGDGANAAGGKGHAAATDLQPTLEGVSDR